MLHPDRFLSPIPAVRTIARRLYELTKDLPIVGPHGHVAPSLLADDALFPEPTTLFLTPDHYLFRMLYSQGVSMEALGVPPDGPDGADVAVESDPRVIWQTFADHYHLFRGTPSRAWLDYELYEVFGVSARLTGATAQSVYDDLAARLREDAFRPRALFDRFGIEVLTTTDKATDDLHAHDRIRASGWDGDVRPCFRPDALFRIAADNWTDELDLLRDAADADIHDYTGFIAALETRRTFFRQRGCVSTDHAVVTPTTERLADTKAEAVFQRALRGAATTDDQAVFEAHMLMEMARMSCDDGLVMQIHPGALRDHHTAVYRRFGPDKGADIPLRTEFTRALRPILNTYGAHPQFRLVVFTLDETTYARELAPLAGHYPALRLGPPWWFHDSIEGMRRFRRRTTETAGIYNTAGFNDDTRAFCSIPARHDLARRVDASYLATLVARHQIEEEEAEAMARSLAYDLARSTYRLDEETTENA